MNYMPSPIAFQYGVISVRWYGILYMTGFIIGLYMCTQKLLKFYTDAPQKDYIIDEIGMVALLLVVVGGRFGHIFLYDHYSSSNLYQMISIWKGGISFHGSVLAMIIGLLLWTRYRKLSIMRIFDAVSFGAPWGIFCGRIGNFLNQELVGHVTTQPWGMFFPLHDYGVKILRHPSQLYEAVLEGPIVLILSYYMSRGQKNGVLTGWTWFFYSLARIFCECFREYTDIPFVYKGVIISWGQIYSFPILGVSIVILLISYNFSRLSQFYCLEDEKNTTMC